MSPVNVDYRAHAQAVRDLLTAALPPDRVFDADDVPGDRGNAGTLPLIYVVPHLSGMAPTFGDTRRFGGVVNTGSWRVNVSISGRTVDEVRRTQWRVRQAMDEAWLVVGDDAARLTYSGVESLPERDGDRYFASIEFTYTL